MGENIFLENVLSALTFLFVFSLPHQVEYLIFDAKKKKKKKKGDRKREEKIKR